MVRIHSFIVCTLLSPSDAFARGGSCGNGPFCTLGMFVIIAIIVVGVIKVSKRKNK